MINKITLDDIKKERISRSFYYFVKHFWQDVDSHEFIHSDYLIILCGHLQAVYEGRLTRLVINIPPAFGKSLICSILFPAWCWTKDPTFSTFCSTRSSSNLNRDANKFFNLINCKRFRDYYRDDFKIGDDARRDEQGNEQKVSGRSSDITNSKKGYRTAKTTGAATTGARAKIIILDDPNDRKDVFSSNAREAINDYVFNTLTTRNFAKQGGAIILVQQRLHEDDVSGKALSKSWPSLILPIQNLGTSKTALPEFKDNRALGEYLSPELFDESSKQKVLKDLSDNEYAGQYDQVPSDFEGNIIKRKSLKYWDSVSDLPKFDFIMQSWDLPFTGTDKSDFVANIIIGVHGANIYIIDIHNEQLEFSATLELFKEVTIKHPKSFLKLVEKKANGDSLYSMLHNTIPGIIMYIPVDGKKQRLYSAEPIIKSGNVIFPNPKNISIQNSKGKELVDELINQLVNFPYAKYDDLVDALTQAIIYIQDESDETESMESD